MPASPLGAARAAGRPGRPSCRRPPGKRLCSDVDHVLTTKDVAVLCKEAGIDFASLPGERPPAAHARRPLKRCAVRLRFACCAARWIMLSPRRSWPPCARKRASTLPRCQVGAHCMPGPPPRLVLYQPSCCTCGTAPCMLHLGCRPCSATTSADKRAWSLLCADFPAAHPWEAAPAPNPLGNGGGSAVGRTTVVHSTHPCCLTLTDEDFDEFLGIGSGAAAIFGTTGGVMEAALRCAFSYKRVCFRVEGEHNGIMEAGLRWGPPRLPPLPLLPAHARRKLAGGCRAVAPASSPSLGLQTEGPLCACACVQDGVRRCHWREDGACGVGAGTRRGVVPPTCTLGGGGGGGGVCRPGERRPAAVENNAPLSLRGQGWRDDDARRTPPAFVGLRPPVPAGARPGRHQGGQHHDCAPPRGPPAQQGAGDGQHRGGQRPG